MAKEQSLTTKSVTGTLWKFAERIGAQLVSTIVSIILARILLPEQYGIVSLVIIFINIFNVFATHGFGTSLVQKKNADNLDFSSVLYTSLFLACLFYVIIFFTAPYLANLFGGDELVWVIRIVSIRLPLAAINSVQQAYVQRKMIFKKFFWSTLFGTLISGVVGIWMAYNGYGVWALVVQYLTNTFIDTVILGITIKWKPQFKFSFKRVKELFSFGWKVLVVSFLRKVYEELRGMIIGTKYTKSELGYYTKGKQYPSLIITNVDNAISPVLLSAVSKRQDDLVKVKSIMRKEIRLSSYLVLPLIVGLACVAEPFVLVLFGEHWLGMVPYLQIMCAAYAFHPLHTASLAVLQGIGKSGLALWLELIKKAIGFALLFASLWFGVTWIAISVMAASAIECVVDAVPNKKLLKYGYREQILDFLPALVMSAIMGVPVFFLGYLPISVYAILPIQIIVGMGIYLLISHLFKNESYLFALSYLKKFFKKGKKSEQDSNGKDDDNNGGNNNNSPSGDNDTEEANIDNETATTEAENGKDVATTPNSMPSGDESTSQKFEKVFIALLKNGVFDIPLDEDVKKVVSAKTLPLLYKVAKLHDVTCAIGCALKNNGLLFTESPYTANFETDILHAYSRLLRSEFELENLAKVFEEEAVDFIPLKGAIIRNYYPHREMRTSCDIDVLVRRKDFKRACFVIEHKLNYKRIGKGPHDEAFVSPAGEKLELHYRFTEDDKKADKILSCVWENTTAKGEYKHYLLMDNCLFAFYAVTHMKRHFVEGGCGLRSFIDLLIIKDTIGYNEAELIELLKKADAEKFYQGALELLDVMFNNATPTETLKNMQTFVVRGGIYGTVQTSVIIARAKHKSKLGFVMYRVFLPYKELVKTYPVLVKWKILYPFVLAVRNFKILFGKREKAVATDKLKKNSSMNEQEVAIVVEMSNKLGL